MDNTMQDFIMFGVPLALSLAALGISISCFIIEHFTMDGKRKEQVRANKQKKLIKLNTEILQRRSPHKESDQ